MKTLIFLKDNLDMSVPELLNKINELNEKPDL